MDTQAPDDGTMQTLEARRAGDDRGHPTWDVSSDELGLLGNFIAETAEDAIAEARADLA